MRLSAAKTYVVSIVSSSSCSILSRTKACCNYLKRKPLLLLLLSLAIPLIAIAVMASSTTDDDMKDKTPTATDGGGCSRSTPNMDTDMEEDEFISAMQQLEGVYGLHFNNDGQLVDELEETFHFDVCSSHAENQERYENIGKIVERYVYGLLQTKLRKKHLHPDKSGTFIFVSEGYEKCEHLLVLIHGTGVVRAGQWARRLIINDNVDSGTQMPYIQRALDHGWGVIVTNTNDNHWGAEGSKNPSEHGIYVWEHFVKKCKDIKKIAIVAHSAGGGVTSSMLAANEKDFKERVYAIAFTDAFGSPSRSTEKYFNEVTINWVTSYERLGKELSGRGMKCVSAGTNKHEETSHCAIKEVFKFIEERFKDPYPAANLDKPKAAGSKHKPAANSDKSKAGTSNLKTGDRNRIGDAPVGHDSPSRRSEAAAGGSSSVGSVRKSDKQAKNGDATRRSRGSDEDVDSPGRRSSNDEGEAFEMSPLVSDGQKNDGPPAAGTCTEGEHGDDSCGVLTRMETEGNNDKPTNELSEDVTVEKRMDTSQGGDGDGQHMNSEQMETIDDESVGEQATGTPNTDTPQELAGEMPPMASTTEVTPTDGKLDGSDSTTKEGLEPMMEKAVPVEIINPNELQIEETKEETPIDSTSTEDTPNTSNTPNTLVDPREEVTNSERLPIEPSGTDKSSIEPSVTDKPPMEPSSTDELPIEPSGTDKLPIEPSGTDKLPIEPSGTDKLPIEPSNREKVVGDLTNNGEELREPKYNASQSRLADEIP